MGFFKRLWDKLRGRKVRRYRDAPLSQVGEEFPIGTPFPVRNKKK